VRYMRLILKRLPNLAQFTRTRSHRVLDMAFCSILLMLPRPGFSHLQDALWSLVDERCRNTSGARAPP
jgi:hypothetical protein